MKMTPEEQALLKDHCENPACTYSYPYHPSMLEQIGMIGTFCKNCIRIALYRAYGEGGPQ